MTFFELTQKYKSLQVGSIILIDNKNHRVIENHHDDVVFLAQQYDESKSFHLFYDEMNPETDDFTLIA